MDFRSPLLRSWHERGREIESRDGRLFCVVAGPAEATPLLVLHGFPSCGVDFHRVVDLLAVRFRVVIHDHLGFGLSEKPPGAAYSLHEQADAAIELWQALGLASGHLLAHDYGTSVATELLARHERGLLPMRPLSLTLSNGSVLIELARLRLSQRIARSPLLGPLFGRLVNRPYFLRVMRRLWADPARARDEDLNAIWEAIRYRDGHLRVHALSGYIAERRRFRGRWVGALGRSRLPVHLLWGRQDPVAIPAIAEGLADLAPAARLTWLEETGHYPMLERPELYASRIVDFLDGVEST